MFFFVLFFSCSCLGVVLVVRTSDSTLLRWPRSTFFSFVFKFRYVVWSLDVAKTTTMATSVTMTMTLMTALATLAMTTTLATRMTTTLTPGFDDDGDVDDMLFL